MNTVGKIIATIIAIPVAFLAILFARVAIGIATGEEPSASAGSATGSYVIAVLWPVVTSIWAKGTGSRWLAAIAGGLVALVILIAGKLLAATLFAATLSISGSAIAGAVALVIAIIVGTKVSQRILQRNSPSAA